MSLLSCLLVLWCSGCAAVLALCAAGLLDGFFVPQLPQLPSNEYWGPGTPPESAGSDRVEPMEISVSKEALAELQAKLKRFKFLQPLEQSNFEYGFNGKFMQRVVQHWLQRYSWKEWEVKLNSLRNYRTQIEGLSVHFIRAPASSKAKRKLPLLLLHGWPGSVLEFYKLIPLLTQPDESGVAFEVVAPSIPGYGWSQAPSKRGFSVAACARVMHKLMLRLGHSRYFMQGGDWGALITSIMARHYHTSIIGYHTNMPLLPMTVPSVMLKTVAGAYLPGLFDRNDSEKLYPYIGRMMQLLRETGYFHLQATRPDTVGHALQDSPVGLAAYIMEKFCVWTQPADRFTDSCNLIGSSAHFSIDELITNVMIYWTTGSITSSMRFYKENMDKLDDFRAYSVIPSPTPYGVASFKLELSRVPEQFLRKSYPNLLQYSDFAFGGHFPALQLPQIMEREIRQFARLAEQFHERKAAAASAQSEL